MKRRKKSIYYSAYSQRAILDECGSTIGPGAESIQMCTGGIRGVHPEGFTAATGWCTDTGRRSFYACEPESAFTQGRVVLTEWAA